MLNLETYDQVEISLKNKHQLPLTIGGVNLSYLDFNPIQFELPEVSLSIFKKLKNENDNFLGVNNYDFLLYPSQQKSLNGEIKKFLTSLYTKNFNFLTENAKCL